MTFAPRAQFRAIETNALVVAAEPAFDFASAEYQALQQRSHTTAFQGARWLAALHRDVAPALGAEPVTITLWDAAEGRLMLVLALARNRQNGVTFLAFADFGLCDDLLLEWLFPSIRRAHMGFSAYPAPMGRDWRAWRSAKLDQSFRRYLDMKRAASSAPGGIRPAARGGCDRPRLRSLAALSLAALQGTRRARRARRRRRVFILPAHRHRGSARRFGAHALPHSVRRAHRDHLLLVGFDAARHGRLSPGLLAIEDTLRASVDAGDSVYDFTIGNHPFKVKFGGEAIPLYEWHQARTIRGHMAVLAIALVRERPSSRWRV
jgi:hypothetical protein